MPRWKKEIRGWKFQPGTIDGKRVPTGMSLHVRLELVPQGGRYRVRIVNAFTGVGYQRMTKPSWPGGEGAWRGRAHLVVLLVAYDEKGNVTSMEDVEQPKKVKDTFRNSAHAAVSQWVFQPEIVGGIARAGRAYVPVCFSGGGECPPARYPASANSKESHGLVAIEPATQLLSDVAGRAL